MVNKAYGLACAKVNLHAWRSLELALLTVGFLDDSLLL